jgi:integrase
MTELDWPAVWERYHEHLTTERRRRPHTVKLYRYALEDFWLWLEPTPWWKVTPAKVREYLDRGCRPRSRRPGQELSPATRACYGWVISRAYAWATQAGLLDRNPLAAFVPDRKPEPVPRSLGADDVARLLEQVAGDPRTELAVWLCYGCGLRAGEVSRLKIEHLQLHGRPQVLVDGKGGRRRRVEIPELVRVALVRGLAGRRHGPVIENKRQPGQHISSRSVSRMIGRAMADASILESAHSLRHTFVSLLMEATHGEGLFTISRLVGHTSVVVTQQVYSSYQGDGARVVALLPDPRNGNGHSLRHGATNSVDGLAALVPVDVRDQLAVAVATLERLGPEVTRALATLQRCTTAAWLATLGLSRVEDLAGLHAGDVPHHSDEEIDEFEAALGIDRGWRLAFALRDAVDD